jgi:hypothetical protein
MCVRLHLKVSQLYMYSCACSLSYNRIDLCTVMTCEYLPWQYGQTALLWASEGGHVDTLDLLVELGASVEAVDKVNIHAHALARTCCIKHVSGIMRMWMIIMSHAYACVFVCMCIYIFVYNCLYIYLHMFHVCTHSLSVLYVSFIVSPRVLLSLSRY